MEARERDFARETSRLFAVDERFEKTVRRKTIRAVKTRARDFAGRPKPAQRRTTGVIDENPAHRVVRARSDRNAIFRYVDSEFRADSNNTGEAFANPVGVFVR